MDTETSDRIERALLAYNEEGVEAMLSHVHPEFEMTTTADIAAEPDTYTGHDGIRRYFESFFEIMDKVEIRPTDLEPRGDRALAHLNLLVRGRATGIEVEQTGFAIVELDEGLLRRIDFFATDEEARATFEAS